MRILLFINIFLLVVFSVAGINYNLYSQQKRGVKVIVKDSQGIPQEIELYQKTYAVIIGIDQYRNLGYNYQLKNAVSDARGVLKVLKDKYYFDRYYELYNKDATKANILKVLQGDLSSVVKDNDAVFVFFAGHGHTQETKFGDEVGYLVPHDGSSNDNEMYKNISMVEIRDNISKTLKAKHIFFVMDACYSGTLLAKRAGEVQPKIDYAYLQAITETPVRQVLTAGGKNQQVLDGGLKGHSVFTGRLIEKLEKAENFITASEIGGSVPRTVFSDARDRNHKQNPQFGKLLGEGDFVFIPKNAQTMTSEGALLAELEKLKAEERKLKQKEAAKNLKKQKAVEAQLEAIKKQQEFSAIAKAKKEAEAKKRLEEEKRKQDLMDEIREKKEKLAEASKQLSYFEAIQKIKSLKDEKVKAAKTIEEQKQGALLIGVDSSPQGEFETKAEYQQRLKGNRVKTEQIVAEYDGLIEQSNKHFDDDLKVLTANRYSVGMSAIGLRLGQFNVEGGYFPLTIIAKDKNLERNPCESVKPLKLYVPRAEAKALRTNESLLDVKGKVVLLSFLDLKSMLDVQAQAILLASELALDTVLVTEPSSRKTYPIQVEKDETTKPGYYPFQGNCNKMIFIKGRKFKMGDRFGHKWPNDDAHDVTLSDFFMSQYEVTVGEYKRFCRETDRSMPGQPDWANDNHPVGNVTWHDATAYCTWLSRKTGRNFRLPTEAEWEYAASSGGEKILYPTGKWISKDLATYEASQATTVGSFAPNKLGLYDLAGNVVEWCQDWWGAKYYKSSPGRNPKGPDSGSMRVSRGGGYGTSEGACFVYRRGAHKPNWTRRDFGFRLVMEE